MSPPEYRRFQVTWSALYMELATLSVCRTEPNPRYGRKALMFLSLVLPSDGSTKKLAGSVNALTGGWLMSASRCKWTPLRPTYPTLTSDFQNISRSNVKFQAHASGGLNALLCVVTTSGTLAAPPPPGLSAEPLETLALGWNGGFPPRNTESLTPKRVR